MKIHKQRFGNTTVIINKMKITIRRKKRRMKTRENQKQDETKLRDSDITTYEQINGDQKQPQVPY